jgi:hypothetical protein
MTSVGKRNLWLATGALVLFGFQNCTSSFLSARSSTSVNLPFTHPDTESRIQSGVAKGTLPLGDRDFLHSVFANIFASNDQNVINFLNAVMNQEFGEVQGMLGRPCEVASDGSAIPCNSSFANIDVAMGASTSSIREAARIQSCRRLFANDTMLAVAIGHARGGTVGEPDPLGISTAIRLFYPAQDTVQEIAGDLEQFNEKMIQGGETAANRWRALFLVLCEAPTWQIL